MIIRLASLQQRLGILGPVLLAASLKSYLVLASVIPFNSDEAIVALMAKHILQGERPIFFYGQAYMGSLDAWLVAFGYLVFGEHVWVIRMVQSLIYLCVLVTTYLLCIEIFNDKRIGVAATILLAIPTVNVSLYTTASLGGYGEGLLLGNITLLVGLRMLKDLNKEGFLRATSAVLFGFLCGFGLWAFGITLVFSLPVGLKLVWEMIKLRKFNLFVSGISKIIFGGVIGAVPWWLYAAQFGLGGLIGELFGGAIAGVERMPWFQQVIQHLSNFLVLGLTVIFGFRPPWSIGWLGLPILPFVLFFWIIVLWYAFKLIKNEGIINPGTLLLHGVIGTLIVVFILTPYGADPSGRYFLPLVIPLSIFAAALIVKLKQRSKIIASGLLFLVVSYNLWGTLQSSLRYPPGLTTQFSAVTQVDHTAISELISFLESKNERFGFTNYWVSYPLAFLSNEEMIFVPRLPYHLDFRYTTRDDRYTPYWRQINEAKRVAYITSLHPDLDQYLRMQFEVLEISWMEEEIGDYHIFYNLSRRIFPDEIGLN